MRNIYFFQKLRRYFQKLEKRITKKFNNTQMQLWNIFIFLMIFASSALILHLLIWINWNPVMLQKIDAWLVSKILNLIGINTIWIGTYIKISGFGLIEIIKDCLGWKSFIALTSLIVASNFVSWKNKLLGIFFGMIFVFIINIIRLVTTFYLATKQIISFEVIHSILWRWGLTLFILLFWYIWIKIYDNHKKL